MTIVAAASAWGCAPGRIAWEDGHDQLRTALWVDTTFETGGTGASRWLLLSNGIFDCNFPQHEDAGDQVLAQERYLVSMIREEAHHLVFTLDQAEPSESLEGAWPLGDADGRRTTASYVRVEEVIVIGGTSLAPSYGVVDAVCESDQGPGGSLEVGRSDDEVLAGRFSLGIADVSGHFEASRCELSDDLPQALLPWGLAALCPGLL